MTQPIPPAEPTPVVAARVEPTYETVLRGPLSPNRIWLARGLAVVADALQLAAFPVTVEGAFSPISDGIDLVMAVVLSLLVGWHIAFVPSAIIKVLPLADLAPTWTIAVLIATRGGGRNALPVRQALSSLPLFGKVPAQVLGGPQESLESPALHASQATPRSPIGRWYLVLGVLICAAIGVGVWVVVHTVKARGFALP